MKGLEELKKRIEEDPVFAKTLENTETYEAFQEKLQEEGFTVTEKELRTLAVNRVILDEELEQVIGGYAKKAFIEDWWIFWHKDKPE